MKLAQALLTRGNLQADVAQLRTRLKKNAQAKEGSAPSENPLSLIEQIQAATEELRGLIKRINRTNSVTELEPGYLISDALCDREILKIRHMSYNDLAENATVTLGGFYRTEALAGMKSAVDVTEVRKEASAVAAEFRRLDHQIQAKNWQVDLLE